MRAFGRHCIAAVALASAAPAAAEAHDFWIDLGDAYAAPAGVSFAAAFFVGHAGESEPWPMREARVAAFAAFGPGGERDLKSSLRYADAAGPGGAAIRLEDAGSHVIAFDSTPVVIELDAKTFNAYIALEGLRPAIDRRLAEGREAEPGRESYSRRAKTIVQVGAAPTDNVVVPIGLTLEITPEENPLRLSPGEPLVVRVTYRGAPLAGALVHLESLSAGLLPETTRMTDEDGRASFSIPRRGAWKFDAVWTEPIEGDPNADFSTVFSSLTFGFE